MVRYGTEPCGVDSYSLALWFLYLDLFLFLSFSRIYLYLYRLCFCICIYSEFDIYSIFYILYSVFYTYLFIYVAVGRGSWAMLVVHSSHFTVYGLRFTVYKSAVGSRRVCHPVYRSFIT